MPAKAGVGVLNAYQKPDRNALANLWHYINKYIIDTRKKQRMVAHSQDAQNNTVKVAIAALDKAPDITPSCFTRK